MIDDRLNGLRDLNIKKTANGKEGKNCEPRREKRINGCNFSLKERCECLHKGSIVLKTVFIALSIISSAEIFKADRVMHCTIKKKSTRKIL